MSNPEHEFNKKILQNLSWHTLFVLSRILITVVALATIVRIADPEIMGVYGLAWVAIALGGAIAQSGAAQSIITIKNLHNGHISAAFVLAVGISVALGSLMALVAPVVGLFYGRPDVEQAYLMGAVFLPLMTLGAVDIAKAQRELNFQLTARVQIISAGLAAASGILFAIYWNPLLGLFALQGLAGFFQFIVFRLIGHSWPSMRFSGSDLREIWSIGIHLSLNSLTAILLINLPQLIVARFLSIEDVGILTLARRILEIVGSQIGGIVNQVIYPSFAAINKKLHRIGEVFLSATHHTAFIMILPLLVLAASPADFLVLYVGEDWRAGGAVLSLLVIMQMGLALGQCVFPTFQAIGKPSYIWKWNLFMMLVQAIFIFTYGRESVEHTAKAIAWSTLMMPVAVFVLSREVGFRFSQWAFNMLKIITPAFLIVACTPIYIIPLLSNSITRVVFGSVISITLYLFVVLLVDYKIRKLIYRVTWRHVE